MARRRSPNYPAIGLSEAIDRVRSIFEKDGQHKTSRMDVAVSLGYTGLSGTSLPVISALSKYGLLEGRGDAIHVTDDAVTLLVDDAGTEARIEALKRAAARPVLFAELDREFPGNPPSPSTVETRLIKMGFIRKAATDAAEAYLETKALVSTEMAVYNGQVLGNTSEEARRPVMQEHLGNQPVTARPPQLPGERERLRFTLSGNREVRIVFGGPDPTQAEIDELMEYLKVSRRTFPLGLEILMISGCLTTGQFKAKARGFLASQKKEGKSGGSAIELLLKQVDVSSQEEARRLATEVLEEIEAIQTRNT